MQSGKSDDATQAVLRAAVLAPGEDSWLEVAERVATKVAEIEPPEERRRWEERFRSDPRTSSTGRGPGRAC